MTEIDFYRLPRAIQDGLLDAFRGQFTPAPLLVRAGTRPTLVAWVAISAVAAVSLTALWMAGFGNVDSKLALHPTPVVAVFILLAATCAIGIIGALAHLATINALPFKPGLFLFPANVIDARDHRLRVYPLAELSKVIPGSGGTLTLQFPTASFSFQVPDKLRTREWAETIESAKARMQQDLEPAVRRKLDPLEPPVVASPLASTISLSRKVPLWERQAWIFAGIVGVAIGGGLFYLRNLLSDNRMFAVVQSKNDVESYKSYLGRGRRHTQVVSQVLLPRSELRLAEAKGSVEAIDAFIQAYPKTGIQTEVDAARHKALVAEFERSRDQGTLAALLSFADRYPNHGLDKEFDEAKHALYVGAYTRYKSEMPTKGADLQAEFVGRLLSYAERIGAKNTPQGLRGPTVQIRFRRLPPQDLERAEELVKKSPMYGGVTSLPTRYITAQNLDPNEKTTAETLVNGLAQGFAPEILTFEAGPALEGTNEDVPTVTSPTLVVTYRIESSGAAHARSNPRGIFLGLLFIFKTDFVLPEDSQPLTIRARHVQRIPLDILNEQKGAPPPGSVETAVYAEMIRGGFAEYGVRYLSKWFKPRKDQK